MSTAWTDLQTNLLLLPISTFDAMRQLGATGVLPPSYMPLFLHEFTHHWCFQCSVGSSLALLHIRMVTMVGEADIESPPVQALMFETALRCKAAWRLLAPAIEGLGLFAEHDAFPKGSPAISVPAMNAIKFFVPRAHVRDITTLEQEWSRILAAHRTSPEGIENKVTLLHAGLSGARWIYPAGYLAIRGLHRAASARSERLHDTDLFLAYAGSVLFRDDVLASLLLAKEPTGLAWVRAFEGRLGGRLDLIAASNDLDARVSEFEQISAQDDDSAVSLGRSIHLEDDARSNHAAHLSRWADDGDLGDLLTPEGRAYWRERYGELILHRSLIRLAKQRAEIEIDDAGLIWATIEGKPRMSFGQVDRAAVVGLGAREPTVAQSSGSLALYWFPRSDSLALLFLRGSSLAAVRRYGSHPSPEPLLSAAVRTCVREAMDEEDESPEAKIEAKIFEEAGAWFVNMPEIITQVDARTRCMWRELALAHVPELGRKTAAQLLAESGFKDVFGGDSTLMHGFAVLAAHHAAGAGIAEIERELGLRGLPSVAELRRRCRAAERTTGIPLLSSGLDFSKIVFFA